MIGPAEIDDMMLDYAEAVAMSCQPGRTERLGWPLSSWQRALAGMTAPTRAEPFILDKAAGRFRVVEAATGREVYTPPTFLDPQSRAEFAPLLALLNSGGRLIDAVMAFEQQARRQTGKIHYLSLASENEVRASSGGRGRECEHQEAA